MKVLQNGHEASFQVIADRWYPTIYRFAYSYFGNRDDASDIAQKTLIKVHQNIRSLKEIASFKSWIYRIANNLCLDEMKRAGRRKSEPLSLIPKELQLSESTPVSEIETKEYDLYAFCIMSNHVHLVFRDLHSNHEDQMKEGAFPVTKIMQGLKFYTGLMANRELNRTGSFWHEESYDRLIRNVKELNNAIQYTLNNPVKNWLIGHTITVNLSLQKSFRKVTPDKLSGVPIPSS